MSILYSANKCFLYVGVYTCYSVLIKDLLSYYFLLNTCFVTSFLPTIVRIIYYHLYISVLYATLYNVFNLDQSNIKEARPEMYAKLVEQNTLKKPELNGEAFSFEPMNRMIRDNRWICPIKLEHQDNAFYSISKNQITLPEKSQFIDGESFYGTAFHEMTHSTGAEDVLNRLKPSGGFGSAEYAREELVAELGSALIAQRYGISKHLKEDSAAYLKSWLSSLKESPDWKNRSMLLQRIS